MRSRIKHRLDNDMSRWWLPLPTRRSVPLMGIALGLALSLGSAEVIATSAGDEATGPAGHAPRDCPEAEPNDEPAHPATLAVHGLVIDAATRRGIARFRVIPGALMSGGATWQPHLITAHRGGRFDLPPDARAWDETRFRVEAEGYRPGVISDREKVGKGCQAHVCPPGRPRHLSGCPYARRCPGGRAQAIWTTVSREATGHGETLTVSSHAERLGARVVIADEAGRFHLPPESNAGMIMVAHRSGYAEIRPADLLATHVVTVRLWCRVEGRVMAGTKPIAGQKVSVYRNGSPSGDSAGASWQDEAVTDADGRFACDRVVQGRLVVDRLFSQSAVKGIVHSFATLIEVREGLTTRVNLVGPGCVLVGRFGRKETGHALSIGTNRQPRMPAYLVEFDVEAIVDAPISLSFPTLSAWPISWPVGDCGRRSWRLEGRRALIHDCSEQPHRPHFAPLRSFSPVFTDLSRAGPGCRPATLGQRGRQELPPKPSFRRLSVEAMELGTWRGRACGRP